MADIDWAQTEADLKKAAADRGVTYDKSDLEDVQRNASYQQNAGEDPSKYFNVAIAKYDARANNEPNHPEDNWGTAKTASGAPAQTAYTVNSNGSLTRTPQAPTPFTIPRLPSTAAPSTPSATGQPTAPPPSPATAAEIAAAQAAGLSPVEWAQQKGHLDQLTKYTDWLYADPERVRKSVEAGVNLYDPSTWSKYAPPGWGTSAPSGSGGSTTAGAPSHPYSSNVNTRPVFNDPTQRLVEDSALNRMSHLNNPEEGSGTQLFESYLKQLADILKGAPFSDTEMAQLKNSVYQDLLSERDATQKRWLEVVSQRGLAPSSGPALEGLKQIDGHFEQLRSAADSQFALAAINQRQQNQLQVANIYGTLAGNEEGRLDKAFQYANVPYGLFNDSFQRNLQLVGAGGSPASTVSSIMGIVNAIQQNNQISSANRASLTAGLLQYLGYLFPNGVGA